MNAHAAQAMAKKTMQQDPLTIRARRDIAELCDREAVASVGWWAYQNGGSQIMGDLIRANPEYSYYHGEASLLKKQGKAIADTIPDTEVAVIMGAGDSFTVKEAEILKHLKKLKKIVLIDVSKSFNQVARRQVDGFLARERANDKISVETIDSDFFKLSKRDMSKIQSGGVTSLFVFGGTLLNSPGEFTDGPPEGRVKDAFRHIKDVLSFGEVNRHSLVISHKLPYQNGAYEEYCYQDPHRPEANVQYWLAHCFAYMLEKADPKKEFNHDTFAKGYTPEAVLEFFKHRYSYEDRANNSRNGLAVKKPFMLQLRSHRVEDGIWTKEFKAGERFYFFNSVHTTREWLEQMGRTADSRRPLESVASFERGKNSVLVMRSSENRLSATP